MATQFKILASLLIDKRLKGKSGIYKTDKREIRTETDSAQTRDFSGWAICQSNIGKIARMLELESKPEVPII